MDGDVPTMMSEGWSCEGDPGKISVSISCSVVCWGSGSASGTCSISGNPDTTPEGGIGLELTDCCCSVDVIAGRLVGPF